MSADYSAEKPIPEVKSDVDLRPYNTLGVSSVAKRFVTVSEEQEIQTLYNRGELKKGSVRILGSGSNILFRGVVEPLLLKVEIGGIDIIEDTGGYVKVRSGAGVIWHNLVSFAVEGGFGGIENLALIPGTVGAAPIQNIGAYGVELEQVFESLRVFDLESGTFYSMEKDECKFSYRESVFKRELTGRFIVTQVTLRLQKPPHKIKREYKALSNWLDDNKITQPGIRDIFNGVIEIRSSKLPDPAVIGNAGSFFKNPVIDSGKLDELRRQYPDVPSYLSGVTDTTMVKIPAAWLIEKTGWRGRRIGDAGTYKNQALVIVNHGRASGEEIWEFAQKIRESVLERFNIELVPEVNIMGSASDSQEKP